MPPNHSNSDPNPGTSRELDAAMASYSVSMNYEVTSSDSSAFSPKSPSPVSSGSPAHVSTTGTSSSQGSTFKSQVPDPIGSSVEWGGPAVLSSAPQHPANVAKTQIASKGGIRHNILGLLNLPQGLPGGSASTVSTSVSVSTGTSASVGAGSSADATIAAATPLNVLSQGTPTPLKDEMVNANTSDTICNPVPIQIPSTMMNSTPIPVPSIPPATDTKGERSFSMQLHETDYHNISFNAGTGSTHPNDLGSASDRKQKRLQRNRESARLSRKRRKQYLEVLENRVNYLCEEMDRGRREHVLGALRQISQLRNNALHELEQGVVNDRMQDEQEVLQKVMMLGRDGLLSRTNPELMMAITFGREYLKSLVIPPAKKYIMWLTLQNDSFYRGGRAASERLSAARIGEKLRSCGHTHVIPSNGMWPLFCNEVALSYDQEEKIRSLQKEILSNQESWLHRHTGASSEHILQSSHSAITNAAESTNKRERTLMDVLTTAQKAKFLVWMAGKRKKNAQKMAAFITSQYARNETSGIMSTDSQRHEAANLYILNHKLSSAASSLPCSTPPKVLPKNVLARFARRPAFESLATVDDVKGPPQRSTSGGNLKRCSSEMSCENLDDDRGFMKKSASGTSISGTSSLTPEAAQTACSTHVFQALGNVTNLIPSHRLARQPSEQLHHIQPAPVVSHVPQVKMEPARPRSPTVSSLFPANYSNELGFYGGQQHQPIVPAPVQSTVIRQIVPDTVMTNSLEGTEGTQQHYISVPTPEPVPIVPLSSNTNTIPTIHPALSQQQQQASIPTTISAPHLGAFRKVPSPLNCNAKETKEGLSDDIGAFVPMEEEDVGFWNVSNQMADDSLFDLTEEDWAIGEGTFIE